MKEAILVTAAILMGGSAAHFAGALHAAIWRLVKAPPSHKAWARARVWRNATLATAALGMAVCLIWVAA